jgi:TNF receptor-associated factor 4
MKVQRRHLTQHKAAECSKRLVPCRYCSKEFVADTLQVHHTKCGRFPVACPNQCDASILAREDLDLHLKDQCPVFGMCCPFRDAGCRFKVCKSPLCFFICCGQMLVCIFYSMKASWLISPIYGVSI